MKNAQAKLRTLPIKDIQLAKKETTLCDFGFLVVADHEDRLVLETDTILFMKADSNYTIIQTQNKQHVVAKTLKWFSEKMDNRFYRIHKSYIVNTTKIFRYISKDQCVELYDGHQIPISRTRKKSFLEFLI